MAQASMESESESRSVVSDSLRPRGLYSPWNSLGQNTGVGSLSLLQGIFPTQGSNWGLLHCRQILYQLNYQGNGLNNENGLIIPVLKSSSFSKYGERHQRWPFRGLML